MGKISKAERLKLLKERAASGDQDAIAELLAILNQRQSNLLRRKDAKRESIIRIKTWSEGEDAFLRRFNGHFGG
jgi:hypothetical protein